MASLKHSTLSKYVVTNCDHTDSGSRSRLQCGRVCDVGPRREPASSPAVQLAVQASQHLLPRRPDRAPGQGGQVKITDTGDVIPGVQGGNRPPADHSPSQG